MPRRKSQPSTGQRFYSISVVSRMLNTHPQTLRMYERLGLIKPRRNERGNRLYSEDDIERVKKIQELTQGMGVNLAGVEVAFKLMARIEELEAELERLRKRFWQAVQEQAEELAAKLVAERWEEFIKQRSFPVQVWRRSPIAKRVKISITPQNQDEK
ncbi:MAG: MerR family transcriptional regulator [Armatimonadetes bacterium]|nr:MerR family transcriptional regulator [Armatimonadota bacterium]MCX7968506.1 MerR family transcriptional regulator [Armatimonadota bacterium]MDW8143260.1 MerR family transcriptional regulator [Armatimonadota bacterium]